MPDLARLNALPAADAAALLLGCCAAPGWARQVTAGRPYRTLARLPGGPRGVRGGQQPGDLAAAMRGHPRIGERGLSGQSRQEQAGVGTDARVLATLRAANEAYEQRFGHVFLICATGLGPGDILAALQQRMANDRDTELAVTAAEIGKINAIRLRRLVRQ